MRNSSNYVHAKFRFILNVLPIAMNQVGGKNPFLTTVFASGLLLEARVGPCGSYDKLGSYKNNKAEFQNFGLLAGFLKLSGPQS